jgi:hypothetical protein
MAGSPEQKRLSFEGFTPFDAHSQSYWTNAGDQFRALLCEGVKSSGDKQGASIAQDVGVNPSQFSEALTGKNQRHFSALWIPRAVYADPLDRALDYLATLKGKKLVPVAPLTTKQIAARAIESALRSGAAGRALLVDAFGSDTDAVVRAVLGEDAP